MFQNSPPGDVFKRNSYLAYIYFILQVIITTKDVSYDCHYYQMPHRNAMLNNLLLMCVLENVTNVS